VYLNLLALHHAAAILAIKALLRLYYYKLLPHLPPALPPSSARTELCSSCEFASEASRFAEIEVAPSTVVPVSHAAYSWR